ncbi:hypothetical protein ONS95_005312 [Cadophora gregata]|uniref:uncharacterized protein n=1 Tax=Cadophora gregata TaxID=51156 RepID=UPI0026DA7358|nr:uncharacterized protein ONS95_005312 [Cadophora gregata]KAK0103278.1 hypothetical protein ONS95_005312 [Cadophora gregata]KAK0107471.1 hypothetical protein ONS96_003285 [Cadophora gregata f. sp. sojae]
MADVSFTTNTSVIRPSRFSSEAAHDDSRCGFHVKDIATFATTLEEAVKGAFPNRHRSKYGTVHVRLIRWEVGGGAKDPGHEKEMSSLYDIFKHGYGFNIETWKIPIIQPHWKLMRMALDLIKEFDAKNNLFIVYYAGHATMNENGWSLWNQDRDPTSESID